MAKMWPPDPAEQQQFDPIWRREDGRSRGFEAPADKDFPAEFGETFKEGYPSIDLSWELEPHNAGRVKLLAKRIRTIVLILLGLFVLTLKLIANI